MWVVRAEAVESLVVVEVVAGLAEAAQTEGRVAVAEGPPAEAALAEVWVPVRLRM
jgi:hypothetical protein